MPVRAKGLVIILIPSFCIITTEKLVKRVQDGIASQKYKKVNYDQLKALAAKKKLAGEEKLIKVKFVENLQNHCWSQIVMFEFPSAVLLPKIHFKIALFFQRSKSLKTLRNKARITTC